MNLNFLNPNTIPDDEELDAFAREVGEALARKSDPAASHIKGLGDRAAGTWEPTGDEAEAAADQTGAAAGEGSGEVVEAGAIGDPADGTPDAADGGDAGTGSAAAAAGGGSGTSPGDTGQPAPVAAAPATPLETPDAAGDKALADWARSLDPRFAQTLRSMERGDVVPVAAADARLLQDLKSQRAVRQPDGSITVQPSAPAAAYASSSDPRIDQLMQENAALRQQAVTAERARIDDTTATREQEYVAATVKWQQDHDLTPTDVEQLMQYSLDRQMFMHFAKASSVIAPDGTVLREAPMSQITEEALNFALAARPDLMGRAAQSHAAPGGSATPAGANDAATSAKKARASSLAAAPTASTLVPTIDPRKMSPDQLHNEMARMIDALEGTGTR